jgi:hypothetical protein
MPWQQIRVVSFLNQKLTKQASHHQDWRDLSIMYLDTHIAWQYTTVHRTDGPDVGTTHYASASARVCHWPLHTGT